MATKISYTAAQRKKLIDASWSGTGKGSAAVRAIKMVRPICATCQKDPLHPKDWYKACEHDPYWSLQPKVIKTPIIEQDEEGDLVLKETQVRTKMVKIPNVTEVLFSVRSNDGQGPQKMAAKGFRMMTEVGLAPMCEMYGCGQSWPTVRTEHGDYCSENHARLCTADALEIKFTVNDPRIQRTELANVSI